MARMVRFTLATAGVAAALVATPLAARTVGSWEVSRSAPGSCMMIAQFDEGTWDSSLSLALIWTPAEERLAFMAASERWDGLLEREGSPAALALTFEGDVDYSTWVHEQARFENLGAGTEAIVGTFGAENNDRLASAITGSSAVTVRIGESDIGNFSIPGSREAYGELLRCAERG